MSFRSLAIAGLCSLFLLSLAPCLADEQTPLFDSSGYRIAKFRSPVPDSVPGARTVSTEEVKQLTQSAAEVLVLIDVLPTPSRPEGLAATTLWLPPSRNSIPSSTWLPNVGYGRLSDELDRYFRVNLERLTQGDKARSVVIYCLADCWMSWNAARRAAEYGYTQVLWFPEGTDGWEAAGLPLGSATPVPME